MDTTLDDYELSKAIMFALGYTIRAVPEYLGKLDDDDAEVIVDMQALIDPGNRQVGTAIDEDELVQQQMMIAANPLLSRLLVDDLTENGYEVTEIHHPDGYHSVVVGKDDREFSRRHIQAKLSRLIAEIWYDLHVAAPQAAG